MNDSIQDLGPSPGLQPSKRRLRPMSLGDILDETIKLYRENFVLLFGITAIVFGPYYLISEVLSDMAQKQGGFQSTFILGVIGLCFLTLTPLTTGASAKAISDRYLDREATISGCYQFVFQCFWPLVRTISLVALMTFGGFLLLFVPGILVALSATFISQVVVLENIYDKAGYRRSQALFRTDWKKTIGVMILVGVIVLIVDLVLKSPISYLTGKGTGTLFGLSLLYQTLISILLQPLGLIATTLLYYDIRIRKEGYDLQVMAEDLGYSVRESPQDGST